MELEYCFDRLLDPIICRKRCENLQKNPLWGACKEQKKLLKIQNLTKNGTCLSIKILLYLNIVESLQTYKSSIRIDEYYDSDCSHPSLWQTFAGDSGIPPKSAEAILLTETAWYDLKWRHRLLMILMGRPPWWRSLRTLVAYKATLRAQVFLVDKMVVEAFTFLVATRSCRTCFFRWNGYHDQGPKHVRGREHVRFQRGPGVDQADQDPTLVRDCNEQDKGRLIEWKRVLFVAISRPSRSLWPLPA